MGKSVSWLLVARVVSILTSLLTASILGRLLSPADFGVQAIISIALLLAASLAEGTFSVPLMQRAEINRSMVASAIWLSVVVGALCMAALMLATPLIARLTHAPRLFAPMLLTALILPLRGLSSVGVALLERNRNYRAISMASMGGNILYAVVAIVMAVRGFGLWSLVIANLVQVALESGLNALRADLPLTTPPSRQGSAALFQAGASSTMNQLLNWAGVNAPGLITSSLLGPSILGFYSRATNLQNTALQLSGGPVARVLIPTFASLQGAPDELRANFRRFMGAILPLNALVTAVAVVHAEAIVRLLLGRKWFAAVPIVQLLFLGFLPRSAYKVSEALAMGSGRYGASAVRQGIYFVAVCTGALIGGQFGVLPLTLGVAIGIWVFYAFSLAQAQALVKTGWGWLARAHGQAVALGLVFSLPDAAATYFLKHLRHPANPGSFKALILILGANAGGAVMGVAALTLALALLPESFGPEVAAARLRGLALASRALQRIRPPGAPR